MSYKELSSRLHENLNFSKDELIGLIGVIAVAAFIFTFRDWGEETLDFAVGLRNFFVVLFIAGLSFFFRLTCQKIYGLSEGYKAVFKVWWTGLGISLIVAFLTIGYFPLVLPGAMVASFMVRYRLGEFRYGFSYWNNGMIAMWGILGSLLMALIFAIGLHFFPQSYLFTRGLELNLLLAFYSLIPIPQLEGVNIFFGSRGLYYFSIFLVFLAAVLLLTKTTVGLIIAIIFSILYGIIYTLISSEK